MTEKEAGRESLSTSSFSKCSQRLRLTQATLKLLCKHACCLKLLERQKQRETDLLPLFFFFYFSNACTRTRPMQEPGTQSGSWFRWAVRTQVFILSCCVPKCVESKMESEGQVLSAAASQCLRYPHPIVGCLVLVPATLLPAQIPAHTYVEGQQVTAQTHKKDSVGVLDS